MAGGWGAMLSNKDISDPGSAVAQKFRTRFRLPYSLFAFLVKECEEHDVFPSTPDCTGRQAMPVAMKVMGALRTLGRATLHDDVAELSGGSAELHRKCFLSFVSFIARRFFEEWVRMPAEEDLTQNLAEYAQLGFPGCIGSIDATHIRWMRCPFTTQHVNTGKEHFPSRAFNVAVSHSGRIMSCTRSHPGSESFHLTDCTARCALSQVLPLFQNRRKLPLWQKLHMLW